MGKAEKIEFVAYTDIGNLKTPKQYDLLTLIDSFPKKEIATAYVRDNYGKDKRYRPILFLGNLLPKIMAGISKYFFTFKDRELSVALVDRKLADLMKRSDATISYFFTNKFTKSMNACKRAGKIVITQEMVAHPGYSTKLRNRELKKWKSSHRVNVETLNHDEIDYFFTISNHVRESFLEEGVPSQKVIVIPYGGCDHLKGERKKRKKKGEPFTFLFVGNDYLIKGIPYLFEAWKKVGLKNAKLKIIGSPGADYKSIPHMNSPKGVEMLGFQNPEEFYPKADAFIFPTLTDGQSKVVPEALSYGLPVIVTSNDGSAPLIKNGKNGWVVKPFSSDALAKKMKQLATKPSLVKKMSAAAQKSVKGYTHRSHLSKIPGIIKKLKRKK